MRNSISDEDVYGLLNRAVKAAGTATAFAAAAGVKLSYVSAVQNAAKPLPRNNGPLTRALGIEWVPPTGGYWQFREDGQCAS